MTSQRLENQIAVVTGSDSGIGQAIAIAFAQEGADVGVTFLHDQQGAEKTRQAVEGAGRRAVVVQFDQRDPAQVARLFETVKDQLGTPTILMNDTGIDATGKHVKDMPIEDWDNEIKTNLYAPSTAVNSSSADLRVPVSTGPSSISRASTRISPAPGPRAMTSPRVGCETSRQPWPWNSQKRTSTSITLPPAWS